MNQASIATHLSCIVVFGTIFLSKLSFAVDVHAIEFPPYTSETMKDYGVAFNALSKHLLESGIEITPKILPPARAAKELEEGNWCLSFYPPYNKQFTQQVFLNEYPVHLGLFADENYSWQELSELSNMRIAILRSYTGKSELIMLLKKAQLIIIEVETVEQGLKLLLKDRVDFVFAEDASITYLKAKLKLKEKRIYFTGRPLLTTRINIWVNLACDRAEEILAIK